MLTPYSNIISVTTLAFDADAVAFFNRVTTAGGTLSATEQTAINTLVRKMKTDGIWTKMKAIYPMVGASAAACAQNLKSSSFTCTFSNGWAFSTAGIQSSSAGVHANTNLSPSAELSQNSASIGVYSRTQRNNTGDFTDVLIGSSNSTYANGLYLLPMSFADAQSKKDYSRNNSNSAINLLRYSSPLGFFQNSRIISSEFITAQNFTRHTNNITSAGLTSFNIYIGALNRAGNAEETSFNQICFAYIGDGLTTTEMDNYYTAVQAFQTTLSRQV
jgi:hypothetical protein